MGSGSSGFWSQTHWSVNVVLFVNVLGKDLFMLFPLKLLCTSLQSLITKAGPGCIKHELLRIEIELSEKGTFH